MAPKKKLLLLPSWYPQPDDKINGSFFYEQAKLVTDCFDIKVLLIRFSGRPSLRAFLKKPIKTAVEWFHYILQRKTRTRLPDDEIFSNPPLIEYRTRVFGLTLQQRHAKRLDAYLEALHELVASGWKPDLIHAHSVSLGGLVAQRIKQAHGIPYLITEHVPFAISNYPEYMRQDIKSAFSKADKVLSLGQDMVRQLGISDINVKPNIVYNLVDETIFRDVCSAYQPGMPLKLITIGAASHYKDHLTLLRAIKVIKNSKIPFELTLLGLKVWGALYDETLDFIRDNGLSNDVAVLDSTDRVGVAKHLSSNNVFVMTSVYETFCVSMIEAMACGLAVITTNHGGGAVELVTHQVGAVAPVRDYKKIAEILEKIYRGELRFHPEIIREHVISTCGTQAFKNRLRTYYEQVFRGEV